MINMSTERLPEQSSAKFHPEKSLFACMAELYSLQAQKEEQQTLVCD